MYSMCLLESFCVFRKLTLTLTLTLTDSQWLFYLHLQLHVKTGLACSWWWWMHGRMGVLRRCAQMSLHLVFCLDDSSWSGCSDLRFARLVRAALVPASLLYSETSVGRVMLLLLTSDHPWIMLLRTIPPHCNCCKHYQYQYQYHSMWPLMGCCGAFLLLHCSEKQDTWKVGQWIGFIP